MKFLKKVFMFLISFLLLISLMFLISGFGIRTTLLNQKFVEKEFKKLNINLRFKEGILEGFKEKASAEINIGTSAIKIDPSIIFNTVFTDEWMDRQVHLLLNDLYAYIKGETNQVKLVISLTEVKDKFLAVLEEKKFELLPPEFKDKPVETDKVISEIKTEILSEFPSEINLLAENPDFLKPIDKVREYVTYFNVTLWSLAGLSLVLILLAFLVLKDTVSWLKFSGVAFFKAGAISLVVGFFASNYAIREINKAQMPPEFITKEILSSVLNDFLFPFHIYSIVFVSIGILLLVGACVAKRWLIKPQPVK